MRRSRNPPPAAALADLGCACATVRRAARAVTQLYDAHLVASDIEGTQFALLSVVSALGPCSQTAIGERLAMDKTTTSRNLKLLRSRGWLELAQTEDGRQRRYVLTPAGQKRLSAARPSWRRAQEHLRSSMSRDEWDAMWKAFRTVTIAADAARRGTRTRITK